MTAVSRRALAGLAAALGAGAALETYWQLRASPAELAAHAGSTGIDPVGSVSRLVVRDADGRRSPVVVWRPPGLDTAWTPIVYMLHGVPGSAEQAAASGIVQATATQVRKGLGDLVLVLPDGNASRGDTEWADSADGVDSVMSRVVDAVVPAVEGPFRRTATRRAVAGFSMGGFGAANLALRRPDLFRQWVSINGYFGVDDPDGALGDPSAAADEAPDLRVSSAAGTRVLLVEDQGETAPVRGEAVRMQDLLRGAGAQVTLWSPPGDHSWEFVVGQWPSVLRWLAAGWTGR